MSNIIDGRAIADKMKRALKRGLVGMNAGRKAGLSLAVLQIGQDPSSESYLNAQKRLAAELGIRCRAKVLKAGASQQTAEREIEKLNRDKAITGIMVHTPAPRRINTQRLFAKIAADKDVEGLSPKNLGRLVYGKGGIAPCTASACMALIDSTGVRLRGKEAVIIGHSDIVGKPLSLMLLSRMATTTVCHIGTYEKGLLKAHVRRAEVLVVSVGKPGLIKGSWIRKGAVVIDVGINKRRGAVIGDVDFNSARKRASHITPVPGGVGPLTTVILMKNLIVLAKKESKDEL